MASNYPTSLDSFTDPLSNSPLNSPSHAGQHQDLNNSVEQLEAKVGTGLSLASNATANQVLVADGSGGSSWAAVPEFALQTGLVYISSITATGTTIGIDNVFTSNFTRYHIVYTSTNVSQTGTTRFRFRSGGSNIVTNYYFSGHTYYYNAGVTNNYSTTADNSFPITVSSGTNLPTQTHIDLTNPMTALEKTFQSYGTCRYGSYIGMTTMGSCVNTAANYDGLQVYQDAGGTLSGTLTVYGWRLP